MLIVVQSVAVENDTSIFGDEVTFVDVVLGGVMRGGHPEWRMYTEHLRLRRQLMNRATT